MTDYVAKRLHYCLLLNLLLFRSYNLPDNVDEANIKASFKDSMLNLNIKKNKESKPKLIEVKIDYEIKLYRNQLISS